MLQLAASADPFKQDGPYGPLLSAAAGARRRNAESVHWAIMPPRLPEPNLKARVASLTVRHAMKSFK
jgi:hypothetical protein